MPILNDYGVVHNCLMNFKEINNVFKLNATKSDEKYWIKINELTRCHDSFNFLQLNSTTERS